jgi:hypothetical protein
VLDLGNLVSIGLTEQCYSLAVLDNSGGELTVIVVAYFLHVLKDSQVSSSIVIALGQHSRLLRAEGRAVLSLGAEEESSVNLGILVTNCTAFSKHICSSFVGQGSLVVEVAVIAYRLLKELGDVLDVSRGDTVVGVHLCSRSALRQRMQAKVKLPLFLCPRDAFLDTHIATAIVVSNSDNVVRCVRQG